VQERAELLAVQKGEVEALLARRSAVEQEFLEQYLAACEQYEGELERLRVAGLAEHGALKRRLEADVAALELHLDGIRATHALNTDKLDYNYRVLGGWRGGVVCGVKRLSWPAPPGGSIALLLHSDKWQTVMAPEITLAWKRCY
jgi:hypothetical protein